MIKNWIVIVLLSAELLLLSGCIVGPYEIRGEEQLTLNSALSLTKGNLEDLWTLWSQAPTKDKIIIEGEILNVALYNQSGYGLMAAEKLSKVALNDEIRSSAKNALLKYEQAQEEDAKQKREEEEQKQEAEQKRREEICLSMKESRQQLFQEAGGRLDDKSAEQVKRLIDSWRQEEKRWFLNKKDYSEFFGKTDFYKAFGQPQRKQLITRPDINIFGVPVDCEYYYFYYACKDGNVQLEIDADSLSEENVVLVSGMNIF